MNVHRIACMAAATFMVAACQEYTTTVWGTGCGPLFEGRPCVALGVSPESGHYLRGDTIGFAAFSDSGLGGFSWTLTGDAVRFIDNGALTQQLAAHVSSPQVVAMATGHATVTVTSAPQGRTATSLVDVHDSSEVSAIIVSNPAAIDPIRVGDTVFVQATLFTNAFIRIAGRPTGWSSSDTTVLVVFAHLPDGAKYPVYKARALKAGSAYLGATFRALRDSVRVTVQQ